MGRINHLLRHVPTAVVWIGGLIPLAWLIWAAAADGLGPDPVKTIEHSLGLWGFQFLIASLCVTPLRRFGLNLIRFRRALGMTAFIYILLHFGSWVWLDMGLRWDEVLRDLVKRPYIILGMAGILAMVPLALTSTDSAIRRLGAARWRRLHRLAYLAVLAGAIHFVLVVKGWQTQPLVYLAAVAALLALRLRFSVRQPA